MKLQLNIKVIYKFSGLLDLPVINFLKNIYQEYKSRSKENIAKHYDLETNFFTLPDKTLTYSSVIFEKKNQDLSDAQNNNIKN